MVVSDPSNRHYNNKTCSESYKDGQKALLYGQKSNSAYSLVNIAQRWRTTYDLAYGRKVYPLVKDVAEYWEDYLTWREDEGRYVILGDSIHEGSGENINPILTLGLVRNVFDLALDMSNELGVDAGSRETWCHILDHLSSWTTQEMNGKTVFRYTEQGTHWWLLGTVSEVYPGGERLQIALARDQGGFAIVVSGTDVPERTILLSPRLELRE